MKGLPNCYIAGSMVGRGMKHCIAVIGTSLILVLMVSSCRLPFTRDIMATMCVVNDERVEQLGYEFHLLLYSKITGKSAILMMPGDLLVGDGDTTVSALAGTHESREIKSSVEKLLDIDVDYVVFADTTAAQALFTILDSLEAFDLEDENRYGEIYDSRWRSLYKNARLFKGEQVFGKILDVTGKQMPANRVRQLLGAMASDDAQPYLIPYPTDMYHHPLYEGAYGKELIVDIVRRLEEP